MKLTTLVLCLLMICVTNATAQTYKEVYVAWSPNGEMIAVSHDNQVDIVDASSSAILYTFDHLKRQATAAAWNSNGQMLAIPSGVSIALWQLYKDGDSVDVSLITEYQVSTSPTSLLDIQWSPSGTKLASAFGSVVDIWDTQTYSIINNISTGWTILTIDWTNDEDYIVTGLSNAQITYVNLETHEIEYTIHLSNIHKSPPDDLVTPRSIDIGMTDNLITIGDEEGNFRILDKSISRLDFLLASGSTDQNVIHADTQMLLTVSWNPDYTRVAGAGLDGIIFIWDADTSEEIARLNVGYEIYSIAWNPDGTQIAYGREDGTLALWNVSFLE